jgi:mRNA interferase MazF
VAPAAGEAPDAGDILWVDFGPQIGHEQAGRRPALVISSRDYNERSSFLLVCPITRSKQPWPFKVEMPRLGRLEGAILVDQIKSIDRRARVFRHAEQVPPETLDRVRGILAALLRISVSA